MINNENHIAFILAQGGNILPIEWISYIVVGALTFVIGMWIRAFIDKPQDLEKRVNQLESDLKLNKKDDEYREKELRRLEEMHKTILEAIAKKI